MGNYSRKPVYVFDSKTSVGLDKIPNNSMVLINDYDGENRQFIKSDAGDAITSTNTVEDALNGGYILDIGKAAAYEGKYNSATNTPMIGCKTLTGTADADGTTTLVGTGTAFDTELAVGDKVRLQSEVRTVTAVTDATHIDVDSAFGDTAEGTVEKLPSESVSIGQSYIVEVAGTFNGKLVGVGTQLMALAKNPTTAAEWEIQYSMDGHIIGAGTSSQSLAIPTKVNTGDKLTIGAGKQMVVSELVVDGELTIETDAVLATVAGGSLSQTTMKTSKIVNLTDNSELPLDKIAVTTRDITMDTNAVGLVLTDRGNGKKYRLYVEDDVVGIEEV